MTRYRKHLLSAASLLLLLGTTLSCNSKKEEDSQTYSPSSSTAVTAFAIKADSDVMEKLDSVYFAIDLDRGIIFNADSLPAGTPVTALKASIKTPAGVSAVSITTTGADGATKEIDYLANSSAELDLSQDALLKVTAQDGVSARSYRIRVNVHRSNPDIFAWSEGSLASIPSRIPDPKGQKTLTFAGMTCSIVSEADGSYTLASTTDLPAFSWILTPLSFPFTPDLTTLCAGDRNAFILSDAGELYWSEDLLSWNATGKQWESLLSAYMEGALGIRNGAEGRVHTSWPDGMTPESSVDADFPVAGISNCGTVTSKWSPWPTVVAVGGRKADGSLSSASWAFDGSEWTVISSSSPVEGFENAMLVPYWIARRMGSLWNYEERDAWLIIGGTKEDGSANTAVWYSPDNGVNWRDGGQAMTLPDNLPLFVGTDAVVSLVPMSAPATPWRLQRRLNTTVDGTTIRWDCPEIFVFGGHSSDGAFSNSIWRAALTRFTFVPLI